MGRKLCCEKEGLNRGAWTSQEDKILSHYIQAYGEGKWNSIPRRAGLKRCGKSCRLRWLNYLRPDIKRGNITRDEEDLIVRLHKLLGNRWSLIAGRLPGRTDNEIKNYWNTSLSKKVKTEAIYKQQTKSKHGIEEKKMMTVTTSSIYNDEQPKSTPIKTTAFKCTKNFSIVNDHLSPLARARPQDHTQFITSSGESSRHYFTDQSSNMKFDFYELDPAEEGSICGGGGSGGSDSGWKNDVFFRSCAGYSYDVVDQKGNGIADDFSFLTELLDCEGGWLEDL